MKKYNYKVSVCVPVYNMEKYLVECMESLVNQTLKDIEIICVNDGSKDSSLDILENYAKKYKNVKIISQENTGLGGARNTAMKTATGEYVGFVDADDVVDLTMYEKLYNEAKNRDADISMCNVKFKTDCKEISKKIWFNPCNEYENSIENYTGEFLYKNTQPWNKIVSNDLIKKTNFEFFKKNGDGMFIILMLHANKIVSIDEKLYYYRVGHSSMSTNYKLDNFILSVDCAKLQIEKLKETRFNDSLKEFFDFVLIYALIQAMTIAALKNEREIYKKYKSELIETNFRKNKYVRTILKGEYSIFKYVGIIYILPTSYYLSRFLLKIIL